MAVLLIDFFFRELNEFNNFSFLTFVSSLSFLSFLIKNKLQTDKAFLLPVNDRAFFLYLIVNRLKDLFVRYSPRKDYYPKVPMVTIVSMVPSIYGT